MPENIFDSISQDVLEMIRCPSTKSQLQFASADLITRLNRQIDNRELFDQLGRAIEARLTDGLVNADQSLFFPVCSGIARLVIDDAIKLPGFDMSEE